MTDKAWRKSNLVAIGVGIFSSLAMIALLEGTFHHLNQSEGAKSLRPENSFPKIVASEWTGSGAHEIPTSERGLVRTESHAGHMVKYQTESQTIRSRPGMIFKNSKGILKENFKWRNWLKDSATNEVIYDVEYETDSNGRRINPYEDHDRRLAHVALLGCSFVFGEGLPAPDTLSERLSVHAPHHRAYNIGIPSGSPANLLALDQENHLWSGIEEPEGIAVYVYINEHLTRVFPSMVNIASWGRVMPYTTETRDGTFQVKGSVLTENPLMYLSSLLLYQSEMARFFGVNFPYEFNEEHFRRFARIVAQIKRSYLNKFPNQKFYLAGYPGPASSTLKYLKPHLESLGLDYLDYSRLLLQFYSDKRMTIRNDGHPTAEANELWARVLSYDLSIRGASSSQGLSQTSAQKAQH